MALRLQYVHWVMHKCIMVKVGGKRNAQKVCKKQVNFSKTGGKFEICGRRLNKKSSEILADENQEIFREKVKLRNSCTESEIFFKIWGESETEGNASWSQRGMDAPGRGNQLIHRRLSKAKS